MTQGISIRGWLPVLRGRLSPSLPALWMLAGLLPFPLHAAAPAEPANSTPPSPLAANTDAMLRLIAEKLQGVPLTHVMVAAAGTIGLLLTLLAFRSWRRNRTIVTPARLKNAGVNMEMRYRALFENANDLIQGIGMDGQLLYANTAWHETLDYTEAEISNLTIFQLIHPDHLQKFKADFQRAAIGIKIKNLETMFLSKFGKRVIVEGSLHCELTDDTPSSIQGIFRDITERKKSQMAIKESEARFSRVFQASPIAIAISTTAEGKIQDVNESFLAMLDYSRGDVVGRTDGDLGVWANPEDRAQIVGKIKNGAKVRDEQCKLRTSNGRIRDALISVESIDLNSDQCLLLMIHDNTERLNLEAQLRQVQKMEGIGQLAAGVAHDFNNILTIIQGHAGRLRRAQALPPQIGESVEQVSMAADRAANLTRQLLTFCRKQAMLPKVMDINETVTHISKMLERILGEDIVLEVNAKKDLPLINADSGMLELVLINLACNARDAMPKGGKLVLSTGVVDITPNYVQQQAKARIGRHVCITITDTGCGMSPETLRRAFEPFFTTKDVGKGTGLGLATVYGIIDQHRGWIEVTSALNRGSTFKIFIPKTDQAAPKHVDATPQPQVRNGKETILLVEDEAELRELARVVLEDYDYRVFEAGSGVQALKVWEEHKQEIEMLLTDMVMPEGMTGRDLAERLQSERPSLKVLYSSGYSPDVVGGYFKLPENSFFLAKPYHPPKLAQAVRECLDSGKPTTVTCVE